MIQERATGNYFLRQFARAVGAGNLFREYSAPELLDHRIEQPFGITIHLEGPKDKLSVICETAAGNFSFAEVLPPHTTFKLDVDPYYSFRSNYQSNTVLIPINTKKLNLYPAYGVLHEGGHLWQKYDAVWYEQIQEAHRVLWKQLFSRAIDGLVWLPHDPVQKAQELTAWKLLGEEEQKAAGIAVYTIGLLRQNKIDLLPQFQSAKSLTKHVNIGLKSHEVFHIPLIFSEQDVSGLLQGNLDIPLIENLIRKRIESFASDFWTNR